MSEDHEDLAQQPVAQEPPHESQQVVQDVEDLDVSETESQSILGGQGGAGKGR